MAPRPLLPQSSSPPAFAAAERSDWPRAPRQQRARGPRAPAGGQGFRGNSGGGEDSAATTKVGGGGQGQIHPHQQPPRQIRYNFCHVPVLDFNCLKALAQQLQVLRLAERYVRARRKRLKSTCLWWEILPRSRNAFLMICYPNQAEGARENVGKSRQKISVAMTPDT